MTEFTLSDLPPFVGKELGVSSWVTVDQSRIDQFAECSGDRQWIYVDVERAKRESPYQRPDRPWVSDALPCRSLADGDRRCSERRWGRIQLWTRQGALPRAGQGRRARTIARRADPISRRRAAASFSRPATRWKSRDRISRRSSPNCSRSSPHAKRSEYWSRTRRKRGQ